ncbi:uncharacterized protein [Venturia canescens]|uniref:uncharacterized protein isoform X2 n=1 Tax=Venturia canescens TaxID=32260 RepID=UPI001C9CC5AF|nr:uncharacterized protein LOC122414862 isoform X2 [Venturia canescens]
MASNDQWPPVSLATSAKSTSKTNGHKRHIKESQQEILKRLNEMFHSTLEPAVILSVVQNCNWELQPSIEGLITLSETVEDPPMWNDSFPKVVRVEIFKDKETSRIEKTEEDTASLSIENSSRANEDSPWVKEASREKIWSKVKRSGTKNRMTSFCGNIAKLKSSEEKIGQSVKSSWNKTKEKSVGTIVGEVDEIFDGVPDEPQCVPMERVSLSSTTLKGKTRLRVNEGRTRLEQRVSPEEQLPNLSEKNEKRIASFKNNKKEMKRNESESLCGLKVEYRLNGMSGSDDENEGEEEEEEEEEEEDDADVVIEDETSDYKINLTSAITSSVSQFLSPSTQAPSRSSKPEIHMISTASPPRTPQRSVHDATFARIKAEIMRGNKILILMRGLPGSGKTTLANNLIATSIGGNAASYVYSTDDFFVNLGRGRVYKFDPLKLSEAHMFNQTRVAEAMRNGRTPIIVDNTNIEAWEMRPYATMAVKSGYTVEILEPNTPWAHNPKRLAEKNTHNVTRAKINERAMKYQIIPSGQKLLDMYGLKYSGPNIPFAQIDQQEKTKAPLPRSPAPLLHSVPSTCCTPRVQSNCWDNNDKNNYVLTRDDIESMRNIDENRYEAANIERRSVGIEHYNGRSDNNDYCEANVLQIEKKFTYADNVFNDYIKELKDSNVAEGFEVIDYEDTLSRACFQQSRDLNDISRDKRDSNEECCGPEPREIGEDSNECLQTLGAIGSERKFNHPAATINPDESEKVQTENNVSSQCWDFTLIREGYKLHSRHGHYVSPFKNIADNGEEPVVSKELDPHLFENKKIVEENREDPPKIQSKHLNSQCKLIYIEKLSNEHEIETLNDDNKVFETILLKNPESRESIDKETEKFSKCETNFSKDVGNYDDGDDNIASPQRTMIGSIFNLLERPSSSLGTVDSSYLKIYGDNGDNGNEERIEESANLIKPDIVDLINGWDEFGGGEVVGQENNNELSLKIISTNPFEGEKMLTDNINSISWKESPFPIDDAIILETPVMVNKRKVVKRDAETMTTLYDLNVAYVGGTAEPGYRELWGRVNKSINEDAPPIIETPPIDNVASKVITFDKSSMTGETNILAAAAAATTEPVAAALSSEKEKYSTNRLDDLIEMFPHYPREYLKTLYEQQCNCDFDWVVDVLLLADVPNLTIDNYEKQSMIPKLSKVEHEKLKQRSHSSSPKNRRSRAKDFRSFSLDCFKDFDEHTRASSGVGYTITDTANGEEDKIFELFYKKALGEDNCVVSSVNVDDTLAEVIPSSSSIMIAGSNSDDDSSETMELDFGRDFINRLENTCGNSDFVLPDEFKPVIKIKKSMVTELYGLWIESMDHQMKVLHARLDERMAKDEAMARAVADREECEKMREPAAVPNLEEIMNMEMALARYHNELKENIAKETPNDMASRLTRQMLYELLPDIDKETLSEILKAHGGNFKETCEIIESNIGRTISKSDSLKKQRSLLERVHEESNKNVDIQEEEEESGCSSPITSSTIVVNPETRMLGTKASDRYYYEDAIARARNARLEAQVQASLRIENYNKAAEAYRKGQPQVAAYYSQMVKLHTENIKAAHANAADEFLTAQTFTQNGEDTLDLHNFYVREALQAVDIFIDYQLRKLNASTKRSTVFFVITGHGARSNNGLGRIKSAVTKKFINRNIRFTEANPGCLKVTLHRRNATVDTNIIGAAGAASSGNPKLLTDIKKTTSS